jgi:hypothetical protein
LLQNDEKVRKELRKSRIHDFDQFLRMLSDSDNKGTKMTGLKGFLTLCSFHCLKDALCKDFYIIMYLFKPPDNILTEFTEKSHKPLLL